MVIAEVHDSEQIIRQITMINKKFWKDAASSWALNAQADVKVKVGSGGQISEELLENPWESMDGEFADFDQIDCEATLKSMLEGGDVIFKNAEEHKEIPKGICLDMEQFDACLEQETVTGFTECFKMLRDCGLPDVMTDSFREIVNRMEVLDDANRKFKKVYEADMSVFIENYIPETLNLSAGYIEYVNAEVDEKILVSTRDEVVEALETLLIGINEKIDEIYRFASIEVKAAAKALSANMNMDGYVDSKFKIN